MTLSGSGSLCRRIRNDTFLVLPEAFLWYCTPPPIFWLPSDSFSTRRGFCDLGGNTLHTESGKMIQSSF